MKLIALIGIIFGLGTVFLISGALDLKTLITGILAGAFGACFR